MNIPIRKIIFFAAGLLTSWQGQAQSSFEKQLDKLYKHTVPLVDLQKFSELQKSGIYVLDTREKEEYAISHLKNARWVGYDGFDMNRVRDIPKDATVVVYCSVGYRSERIGERLQKEGFETVYNLYGGIFNWFNHENPIVDNLGEPTDSIHTYNKRWSQWVLRGEQVW